MYVSDLKLEAVIWTFFALGRGEALEEVEESTGRLRLSPVAALDEEDNRGGGESSNKCPIVPLRLVLVLPDVWPRSCSRAASRAALR